MKKNENDNSDLLQHVEPQRRKFLAKLIAAGVALPVMSSIAFGQDGAQGRGKGKGGAGGKGKGGAGGKGKGRGGASNPDPAELAASLLKEFDKDGDKALNLKELTAALKAVGERSGTSGAGKGKGKGGGAGKGKGGFGKGKGKGDAQAGGAVKPQRPRSE